MPVIDIKDAYRFLQPGKSLVGLDLGSKTIGIAASDLGLRFANPRPVLKRVKFAQDAAALCAVFEREAAALAVIGLPFNMNGSSGPRVQATRAFVRNMEAVTAIPFIFWDERLSTVAVERSMIANNVSRARRSARIDSAAAAFILQGALDRLHFLRPA
ncbi:Holliday junction resolvase RuvX [Candidatus Tokpelaia sp.]|uniref:Holliday junction resolvase RuvX n=1 Tax=Candidatus Tokpelaia sp. TaxID=2233777 RepID=UPI00123A985A|nr:Holliday junction resolvase RuvX [Candidatus Tokpelaia sp.]KAA6404845.1 Holliday junction resolvase RuvX [Candidatus Tokpelaia sp.]